MKNENIKKINKIGKISRIFLIIMQVCLIIGIIGTIIVGIVSLELSDDLLEIEGLGNAQVIVNEGADPLGIVDIDLHEANFETRIFGVGLKWVVDKATLDDGRTAYSIDAAAGNITWHDVKLAVAIGCFIAAIVEILLLIALMFAKKLAKALEVCESPFEAEVLRRMKIFGFALLPWAVFMLSSGISAIVIVLLVLVIILFSYIFNYGAQLQQESDETL